jgi:hypothetical protein
MIRRFFFFFFLYFAICTFYQVFGIGGFFFLFPLSGKKNNWKSTDCIDHHFPIYTTKELIGSFFPLTFRWTFNKCRCCKKSSTDFWSAMINTEIHPDSRCVDSLLYSIVPLKVSITPLLWLCYRLL